MTDETKTIPFVLPQSIEQRMLASMERQEKLLERLVILAEPTPAPKVTPVADAEPKKQQNIAKHRRT